MKPIGTSSTFKILGATSIRSDYDLMSGIYRSLAQKVDIEFQLLVSGAHLSPTFGNTVKEIYKDQLPILAEVETLIDASTPASRLKTASLLLQSTIHTVTHFAPDLLIFAGDREDALMMAILGSYLKIPMVHFFGGDHAADGNVDNPVRHAISKLVSAHFVTHESHRRRLLRIGEPDERIFVIGNPAIDRLRLTEPMNRTDLFSAIGVQADFSSGPYAIVIYHPTLNMQDVAANEVQVILQVLSEQKIPAFISSPNTDAGARQVLAVYEKFFNVPHFYFFKNLPRLQFVNLLRHASVLLGNSSLGLLEAPSIPLGVVNVGMRQRGRLASENVLFVDGTVDAVRTALKQINSHPFQTKLTHVHNPYGDGHSVERAVKLICQTDFARLLFKPEDPLEVALS